MKIKSVTPIIDAQDYYDITVEDSHNFLLSNGSIVHNCGTGVGFSCERQEIAHLPAIPDTVEACADTIVVEDSKEGWAKAYGRLVSALYLGDIPNIDYSKVRPAGARLKTFGGRASGPAPLKKLFDYTIGVFQRSRGKRLTSIDVHDVMCMVGEIVVVGGVRRAALISLSNLSDMRMRDAKTGNWRPLNPQRDLANNSVAYTEKPDVTSFMDEWVSLIRSYSGERGIFNRVAAQKQAAKYGRRSAEFAYGCNPCCISGDALVDVMVAGEQQKLRFKDAVTLVVAGKDLTIKSYDSVGVVWQPITSAALMRKNAEVIKITDVKTGKSVTCTPDHLIFTSNRGWVPAAQLHSDDELVVE